LFDGLHGSPIVLSLKKEEYLEDGEAREGKDWWGFLFIKRILRDSRRLICGKSNSGKCSYFLSRELFI